MNQDRRNLEWLVSHCLEDEHPCITMSRGRELLGFVSMDEMRDWRREWIGGKKEKCSEIMARESIDKYLRYESN